MIRSNRHFLRLRKDREFSPRIAPYFPSSYSHASPFGRKVSTGVPGNVESLNDVSMGPHHSNVKPLNGKEAFQNYLTRKWIRLLGLSMYFKNE